VELVTVVCFAKQDVDVYMSARAELGP
jgi:hypothetical protein